MKRSQQAKPQAPQSMAVGGGVSVTKDPRGIRTAPMLPKSAFMDEKGHFKKGNPGGGRPKGSVGGRARALMWLDGILCEQRVKKSVKRALRNMALTKPIKFYKEIVMPLVPKEVLQRSEGERKLQVRIVMSGAKPSEVVPPKKQVNASAPQPRLPDPDTVEGEVVNTINTKPINLGHPAQTQDKTL